MKGRRSWVIGAAGSVLLSAGSAQAALLNLTLLPSPDITSGFIDVVFNATTRIFSATGFAFTMFDGTTSRSISAGTFNLSANINTSGVATSGSITIGGSIPSLSLGSPLLTGTITGFGFQPGGGSLFEFLFRVTGGSMATPAYYGLPDPNSIFGVILNANGATFTGNWNSNFNNNGGQAGNGTGVSDTAPIPAPSAALPIIIAGILAGRRRRR